MSTTIIAVVIIVTIIMIIVIIITTIIIIFFVTIIGILAQAGLASTVVERSPLLRSFSTTYSPLSRLLIPNGLS